MRKLAIQNPKNSHAQQTGRGLVGFILFIGILAILFQCAPSNKTGSSASNETAKPKPKLDYSEPVITDSYALVCNQSLLISAAYSRKAGGGLHEIYDAFTAIWNRSEKIKNIGCEEWREGIPVYFVHRMDPPFDEFVSFSTSQSGMSEYFTMESHLKNKQLPLKDSQLATFPSSSASTSGEESNVSDQVISNASGIASLTEADYIKQFRCPETYGDTEKSKQALAGDLEWFFAHHSNTTVESFLTYRKKLLVQHQCERTLKNLLENQE